MKKIKVLLAALMLCAGMCTSVESFAQETYIYDHADLLTVEEEARLQEIAESFHEKWDMNVLVVTIDDAEGKSSMEYADDYYDLQFPEAEEEDGVLYLIDMDNREIYLSTCGEAIRYLTDDRIDDILYLAYDDVSVELYYETFLTFFEETEFYFGLGIPDDQYHYDTETGEIDRYQEPMRITWMEFLVALIAAAVAAGAVIAGIIAKYQLKFEDFHYDAYTDSDVTLSIKQDRLVNKFVTHRRIPKNNSSSRSGGGGSRSSTHRSSSGRSHGGGGRKF